MRPLRSLRNRLALIFALIVLAAIGGLYVYVTPPLQERLVDQKLQDLTQDATRWAPRIARSAGTSVSQRSSTARVQSAAAQTARGHAARARRGTRRVPRRPRTPTRAARALGDMQSVADRRSRPGGRPRRRRPRASAAWRSRRADRARPRSATWSCSTTR